MFFVTIGFIFSRYLIFSPKVSFAQYCVTTWTNTSTCSSSCTLTQEDSCDSLNTRTVPCSGGDCATPTGGCVFDEDCTISGYICVDSQCILPDAFCGDGICDAGEGYSSCQVDCPMAESTVCGPATCPDGSTGVQLCVPSCTDPDKSCRPDCTDGSVSTGSQQCDNAGQCTGPANCGYNQNCGDWACDNGVCQVVNCQCATDPTPTPTPPGPTPTPTPTPTCAPPTAPALSVSISGGSGSKSVAGSACSDWAFDVICTNDATPTWNWTDTSAGGYCAVTETGLWTQPLFDPGQDAQGWLKPWQAGVITIVSQKKIWGLPLRTRGFSRFLLLTSATG